MVTQYGVYQRQVQRHFGLKLWFRSSDNRSQLEVQTIVLARELGLADDKTPFEQALQRLHYHLSQCKKPWLIVFDNAKDAEMLTPILPASGGHILITTRSANWSGAISIDLFTPEEGEALVHKLLQRADPLSCDLCKELGYLPLGIVQACAFIRISQMSVHSSSDYRLRNYAFWPSRTAFFRFTLLFLFFVLRLYGSLPWIDIPDDSYAKIAQFQDKKFEKLDQIAAEYHTFSKTDVAYLEKRIESLSYFISYTTAWQQEEKDSFRRKFLRNITETAKSKQWYLGELLKLYMNDLENPDQLKLTYHPNINIPNRSILYLANKRMYDSKLGLYWGEFYWEVLDPCHRQLTTYLDRWRKLKKQTDLPPFFLWLEEQNLPKDILYITYLSAEEREKCRVICKNGLLYFAHDPQKPIHLHSQNKEFIFTIDLEDNLYLKEGNQHIHHTSISYGLPVLGAGNMTVVDGVIESLGFESGHYMPTIQEGAKMVKILLEHQYPFASHATILYFHQNEMHPCPLNEFIKKFLATY